MDPLKEESSLPGLLIRKAQPEDIAILRNFEQGIVEQERSVVPNLRQQGLIEYYDIPRLISSPDTGVILIAELRGICVGCGLTEIRANESYYSDPYHGYIGLMFVEESERGNNIGGLIIDELVDWLHDRGIQDIRLKVYAANEGAVRSYLRNKFKPFFIEMKLTE